MERRRIYHQREKIGTVKVGIVSEEIENLRTGKVMLSHIFIEKPPKGERQGFHLKLIQYS